MARIEIPTFTTEQQTVIDEAVSGKRGRIPAPLRAWIASPELARRAQHLGEFTRYSTSLPPRLSELAILVTARFWSSQFEWFAHAAEAHKAGIDEAAIEAIATRVEPDFAREDERLVYAFARRLHEDHLIAPELYAASVACLGERGVVDLVGLLGYYTLVAMTLNTFEIGVPDGTPQPLPV